MVGLVLVALCVVTCGKQRRFREVSVWRDDAHQGRDLDAAAEKKTLLTSSDLGGHSLCEGGVLGQLLPEALTHVVINIVGTQQFLKGLQETWYCEDLLCSFSRSKNLRMQEAFPKCPIFVHCINTQHSVEKKRVHTEK